MYVLRAGWTSLGSWMSATLQIKQIIVNNVNRYLNFNKRYPNVLWKEIGKMISVELIALEKFNRKIIELICGIDELCMYTWMVETNET